MIKRHEVRVLLDAGFSHRQVAKRAGVSKRSVTRIAQEPSVESIDEVGAARSRGVGRPNVVGQFRTQVKEILEAEPKLPTVEVFHRMKLKGYTGGKSAVYELVKRAGEVESLHFAGYRLKYSRWAYIEVVPNQQVEPLCRALVRAFAASEGVPWAVVFEYVPDLIMWPVGPEAARIVSAGSVIRRPRPHNALQSIEPREQLLVLLPA